MKRVLLSTLLLSSLYLKGQNFNFSCTKDTVFTSCSGSCVTLEALIPDLKSQNIQTNDYDVVQIAGASGGCFTPYIQPDIPVTSTNLIIDDRYSTPINLGFNFNFYGNIYTQLIVSTNGYISFDVTKANAFSHFQLLQSSTGKLSAAASGTPLDLPSTLYDRALIMGAYQDLNIKAPSSPDKKIDYTIIGNAPYRKFVLNFYKVPQYYSSCYTLIENTQQIVLHESTGIIEVFIYSRESCSLWNQGRAMIGIQNYDRTQAIMPPGRAASDPIWSGVNMNESWRFVPSGGGGASLLKRVELYDLAGNLVSTGSTAPASDGYLQATFPNVCSPAGTTSFIVRPVYQKIDDLTAEVYGSDTINLTKISEQIQASTSGVNPTCTDLGSVTASSTSGNGPFEYSLNGGAFQTSGVFTGLDEGNYTITVKDALGCTADVSATLTKENNFSVATVDDQVICLGQSFTATTTTNGATSFNWSGAGINNPDHQNPVITPVASGQYTVTATFGSCVDSDVINVTVLPSPQINAGANKEIIAGDAIQLQGSGSAGTYLWTPSTSLSAANILNPIANPSITTTYTLEATNTQGCSASDEVTITVIPYCIKPMEAFTPNGDGINDTWLIANGNCLSSAKVQIFNRMGNIIFEEKNYSNQWNGTYKGKPVADGTYYYIISYQLINGKTVYLRGNVTILR